MFSAIFSANGTAALSLFEDWGSNIHKIFGSMIMSGIIAPDLMGICMLNGLR
jgi:hypothetical protein